MLLAWRTLTTPLRWFLRQSLTLQILEGLILGIATGLLLPSALTQWLTPVGDGFIRLFQMPVLPFLSLSLMAGVGRLNMEQAGRLLSRAAAVLLGFWVIVLAAVLMIPLGFPAWQDASFYRPSLLEAAKPLNLLELFIPVNPFAAYAQTQIPAVVLFSLALGIALILVPKRQPLIDILDRLSDGLLKISAFVSRFTPLGVFAILASTAATLNGSEIPRLGIYVVLQGGVAVVLTFVILPLLVQGLTPIPASKLLRRFRTPLTIAFATANLLVVLPLMVERGKELLMDARSESLQLHPDDRAGRQQVLREIELPVEVLTPLALVFPDMGRILSLAFVPFAGWMSGHPMGLEAYPGFLATGIASTFLEGVLAMTFLLNRLGLPTDLVQLYIALDQLAVARIGTLLACMSVLCLVMLSTWFSLQPSSTDTPQPQPEAPRLRVLPFSLSLLLLPLVIGLGRIGFSRLPAPINRARNQLLNQGFIRARGPALESRGDAPLANAGDWEAIQRRGVIRFCVAAHDYPMAFRNNKGQLVGSDVEMGLLFAQQLGVEARFRVVTPSQRHANAPWKGTLAMLEHQCDMDLSLVVLNPQLSSKVLASRPEQNLTIALLLVDARFSDLHTWSAIKQRSNLRVGMLEGTSFFNHWSTTLLPKARFIRNASNATLINALTEGRIDVLLMSVEKASSWTVLNPALRLIVPQPVQTLPETRLFPLRAGTLLRVWENWMDFQTANGLRKTVFDHWVEGLN